MNARNDNDTGDGRGRDSRQIVVSAPFIQQDEPDSAKSTEMQLGEVYARRGMLVGCEAVILDVEQHDYVAAYLYYCSAVKILVESLKG